MRSKGIIAFLLLFVLGVTFVSCGDTEPVDPALLDYVGTGDDNGNGNNNQPVFKVDFNNQTYTATATIALVTGGSITVSGMKSDGSNVTFLLNGITTGTYPANDSENNFISYQPAGSAGYAYISWHPTDENANTGAVVVTSVNAQNQTISGTFNFTGYWSNDDEQIAPIVFTNGVFTNIPYVVENPAGDTFYAKVNGVEFQDTDIFIAEIEVMEQEFISVIAMDASDQTIRVNLRSNLGVGTHTVSSGGSAQINYEIPDEFEEYANTGSVTIIEKTATRIKGTFSATVSDGGDAYQITEGAFDVEY
ncbi:MAG: DUF6252 family protein [Flavobacteriaceae bacterium]|nr:DUF6252 family protein [Flavobacteriaceae bacterium]